MEHIIVYGSQYGSTRRYAQKLSEQTGIPAISYKDAPALSDRKIIVYLGGLYAGGVLGLGKTLGNFSLRDGQRLLLVTVGLADPKEPENRDNIRASLQRQLSGELLDRAKIFHLRGGIDYQKLSFGHRTMMKLLYQSLRRTPLEKQTAENRALIETYGKQVDFTDFNGLEPIILEIQRETI
ncbi:flavodoxin domain-containing protein [Candidatus Acetatifactor stercoripullorum]|nr:flavodoxin domain-containing protein [Candidatus Acetatifactor stercoripullorum]